MGQTYYTAKWFRFIHIYLFFFSISSIMEMNLKKYIYNWITLLYTWNTGNSTIFQSLKLFKKICHWTSNQLCFPCLFPLPTGRNPKYPKTEETLSQAGAGHGLFTNEVWWVFFASISAALKSSGPSWKAVACVCVCVCVVCSSTECFFYYELGAEV